MSVAIGSAKSTVSRIAKTLESEGFLVRNRNGERYPRYRLGPVVWELGCQAVGDNGDFPQRARPYLEEIVASVNESAHAAILDGADVLHVERVLAARAVQTFTRLGARYPVHCSATGRAMLAFQPEVDIKALLTRRLARYTDRTTTDPAKLRRYLDQVRIQGFAMAKGEWRVDTGGIAVPVRDRTGRAFGALGVTLPLSRYPENPSKIATVMRHAAERLSREFGFISKLHGEVQKRGAKALVEPKALI